MVTVAAYNCIAVTLSGLTVAPPFQNADYTTKQIRDLSSKLEVAENSCTRASYTGPVAPDVVRATGLVCLEVTVAVLGGVHTEVVVEITLICHDRQTGENKLGSNTASIPEFGELSLALHGQMELGKITLVDF